MSHFAVIVVGDNPEEQLQPYHDFLGTAKDDQYVQDIDITQDVLDNYEEDKHDYESIGDYCLDYKSIPLVVAGQPLDLEDKHKYGYAVLRPDGSLEKVITRTNPNAKWDWYTVGGRWSGFFLLKDGTRSSRAYKYDIDFAEMKRIAAEQALTAYDEAHKILLNHPPAKTFSEFEAEHKSLMAARQHYFEQGAVKSLLQAALVSNPFIDVVSEFNLPKHLYIRLKKALTICPLAYVINGEWHEEGDPSWFGHPDHREKDDFEWATEVNDMLHALPNDTLLTQYDCHI